MDTAKILCLCGKTIGYKVASFLLKCEYDVRFIVNAYEKNVIEGELRRNEGHVDQTSKGLKLPRKTLYDKLKKHDINPSDFRKKG